MLVAKKIKRSVEVMKKILMLPLTLLVIFSLAACGGGTNNDNTNNGNTNDTTNNDTMDGNMNDQTNGADESSTNSNDSVVSDRKIEVADDAADKIAELDEVDTANVLVTNENAYVGVVLKEGTTDNEALEEKIAEAARNANAEFKNVYISFNPDYAKQLTDYGDRVRSGDPVEGFFDEFTDSIQRMFPDAK